MKRCYQAKSSLMGLAALLLLPAAGAWAQGAAAEAVPTKIAVMNVRQAIVSTAEGKQASAQLQSQFAPQQTDLENTQKQITDVQNRLTNGARTLSDDGKARLQREGEMLSHQFQRKQDDLNEVVQAAQGDVVDTIGRKMLEVLDRYSREKGYAAVLDTSAQGTPVIYGSSQIDITQDIVRLYDQQYPIKASSATPGAGGTDKAPAAPKPAPTGAAAGAAAPKKVQ
jgi:outer membrane protein